MARSFLTATTGLITLSLSLLPLSSFAAMDMTETLPAVRITAAQCEDLLAPHAFSEREERQHRTWHDTHDSDSLGTQGWVNMHTLFHKTQEEQGREYARRVVACADILQSRPRVSVSARLDVLAVSPIRRIGGRFVNVLLVNARPSAVRADARLAGARHPTRRAIVAAALNAQVSRELFASSSTSARVSSSSTFPSALGVSQRGSATY